MFGISFERCLGFPRASFKVWASRSNIGSDASIFRYEEFWATLPPSRDIEKVAGLLGGLDYVLMVDRPTSLLPVTKGWLNRHGITPSSLVMQSTPSLRRYDCRLRGLDAYIDRSPRILRSFRYDKTIPVLAYPLSVEGVNSYENLYEAILNLESLQDVRKEYLWEDT